MGRGAVKGAAQVFSQQPPSRRVRGSAPSSGKQALERPAARRTPWGNLTLVQVFNAALNGDTIGGNLTSTGGGAGLLNPETDFVPFSIKDDVVGGNLTVTNLTTVWFGVIRTQVGKNVMLHNITLSDPDGNEYVSDVIAGTLNCRGNSPAPQVGDSGGAPDVVGKHALGQCAHLVG